MDGEIQADHVDCRARHFLLRRLGLVRVETIHREAEGETRFVGRAPSLPLLVHTMGSLCLPPRVLHCSSVETALDISELTRFAEIGSTLGSWEGQAMEGELL